MSNGRRVVVTAGADGIGLAITKAIAANGDRMYICDINEQAVKQVTDDNPAITGTVCDVSSRSSVEAFVQAAASTLGGIDVLINNAGISGPTARVEEMDPDQWDAVLAVNLTGTFNVTRLSIPFLKKSDAGVIIIMSSVGGRFGYPDRSPYATTKRGLIGLTETLAIELGGDGIRVNAIAPGAVEGERIQRVLQGRADASDRSLAEVTADGLSNQSVKCFVDPNDIAALSIFLASDSPSRSPDRPSPSTATPRPPSNTPRKADAPDPPRQPPRLLRADHDSGGEDAAVRELQPGVPAVTSASPREPADRRIRVAVIAAYGAAALAFAYATVSLYWAAGGTALLATVGGTIEEVGRRGGLPAIALGSAATVLKAAGGMLALALIRPWGRAIPRRWLLTVVSLASAVLICYGALQVTAGALVLSGAVHPAGLVDRTALRWHVALWDMSFLVWGLLLAIAVVADWRPQRESR